MTLSSILKPTLAIRSWCCNNLQTSLKPLYVRTLKRGEPAWGLQTADLASFPEGSLGHDVYRFLTGNGLHLMANLETHDVFHVLLGYKPTVPEEVCLQAVLLANGRHTLYVWGTVILGWVVFPEFHADFKAAYQKGKALRPFQHWNFRYLLHERTADVQAHIGIKTTVAETAAPVFDMQHTRGISLPRFSH
jgi:hypothetical protein